MFVRLTAAVVLFSLVVSPLWAAAYDVSGNWVASAYGASLKAHVNQKGSQISGVANIYPPFGKKMTYHFSGTVNGTKIVASHFQGHSFSGRLTAPGVIQGVVRTKKGRRIPFNAHRR